MSHRRSFTFPTTIHFGPGARKLVAAHLHERRACKRPLIVTDRALAALPLLAEFTRAAATRASTSRCSPACAATRRPARSMAGAAAYRAHGADASSASAAARRSTWPRRSR